MNKIWIILKREYKTRVAKRSFLLMTILIPLLIFGFYAGIIAVAISGGNEIQNIAVIDKGSLFNGKIENKDNMNFTFITDEPVSSFLQKYHQQGYTSLLYISPSYTEDTIYSETQLGPVTKGRIEKVINNAIENKRMVDAHIDPTKLESIKSDITITAQVGKGNEFKKGSSDASSAVGYASGILIYITMFIYGMMVMRGVMEEKINRIAEVIVSSVKPFQLMVGKIIGIGAVGLTQFIIWVVLMFILQFFIPVFFPSMAHSMASAQAPGQQPGGLAAFLEGFKYMNFGLIVFAFIFYFLGGFLLYASLFAAVGSAVSEDQQEAQQLTLPITMPIVLAFVIMTRAAAEPESGLAVFGSLFPLTSPIVMMARIPYGIGTTVPWWQLGLSMLLLVLGFLFTAWLAGKIYRTGILMYGKKASWKEMWKWAFRS
ncbi:MAG TPA: ABC transporter permease [Puia sp.]|nr:ABC transporter permease [Puia sp.]